MGEGLDVGTLTGRIELEDRLTNVLEQVGGAIGKFEEGWKHAGSSILENAASFFSAEAALHAVEGAIHMGASALKELTIEGAAVADVEENFNHLTETAGRLGSTLLGALKDGTHNTISDFELMKAANSALALGVDLTDKQYRQLADGAFALAQAKGIDVAHAFEVVDDAMIRGQARGLRQLDLTVDSTKAEEAYAARLKVRVETLTEEEKVQATREAILNAVAAATQRLGAQTDGLDEKVGQARAAWANFTEELGKTVATSPVILTAFDDIRAAIVEAFGGSTQSAVKTIANLIDESAISVMKFAETGADVAGVIGQEWNAAKVLFKDLQQIIDGDVLAFKYLAEGVAEVGKLLHLPGAAEEVDRLDNEIQHLLDTMSERGKSIQDDKKAEEEWAVVSGEVKDKIEQIREHMIKVKDAQAENTGETEKSIDANHRLAGAAGESATAVGTLGTNTRMTKEEIKAYNEAMKDIASVGKDYHETLNEIDGETVEAVKYYLEAGVSLDKLKVAYQLTDAQAQAIAKSFKENTEAMKDQLKAIDMLTDLWNNYYEERASLGATDSEKIAIKAEHDYEVNVKKLQDLGDKEKSHYDQLWDLRKKDMEMQDQQRLLSDDRTKASLDQRLRQAQDTYKFMTDHSDQYTTADINNQKKIIDSLKNMRDHWNQVGVAVDKNTEKVRTLSGEVVTLKEYEARQAGGGAMTYDLSTADGVEQYRKMNPGATIAWSDDQIVEFAKKGGTLQQLIQMGVIKPYGNYTSMPGQNGMGGIPGFAEGGAGDFGSGTLAMLHGKEAIVPLDKAGAGVGGGGVTNHFYVNGTATDVARQISEEIMRQLKMSRQFGAA